MDRDSGHSLQACHNWVVRELFARYESTAMDPLVILGLSYAGKEAVAVVGEFTKKIFGPSAEALGNGISVPFVQGAESRAERAKQVVIDAATMVDAAGQAAQAVPGR